MFWACTGPRDISVVIYFPSFIFLMVEFSCKLILKSQKLLLSIQLNQPAFSGKKTNKPTVPEQIWGLGTSFKNALLASVIVCCYPHLQLYRNGTFSARSRCWCLHLFICNLSEKVEAPTHSAVPESGFLASSVTLACGDLVHSKVVTVVDSWQEALCLIMVCLVVHVEIKFEC